MDVPTGFVFFLLLLTINIKYYLEVRVIRFSNLNDNVPNLNLILIDFTVLFNELLLPIVEYEENRKNNICKRKKIETSNTIACILYSCS